MCALLGPKLPEKDSVQGAVAVHRRNTRAWDGSVSSLGGEVAEARAKCAGLTSGSKREGQAQELEWQRNHRPEGPSEGRVEGIS